MAYKMFGILFLLCGVELIPMQSFNKGTNPTYSKQAIHYLQQYGYLQPNEPHTNQNLFKAIQSLQSKMGLELTGLYDKKTQELMTKPRCGELDIIKYKNNKNVNKTDFTFVIDNWSDLMSHRQQKRIVRLAFYSWRKVLLKYIHLHWNETNPDFRISFTKVINNAKSIKDTSLTKIVNTNSTTKLLFHVNTTKSKELLYKYCKHMFGHMFDKQHGNMKSVMAPILIEKRPPHRFSVNNTGNPIYCNSSLKSIHTQYNEGTAYITAGDDRQWKVQTSISSDKCKHRIARGYPKKFSERWTNGKNGGGIANPEKLDDVFVLPYFHWDTFFFAGDLFYQYKNLANNWNIYGARKISDYWIGIPNNIDAVFYVFGKQDKHKVYFLKEDLVYLFDVSSNQQPYGRVNIDYPKNISEVFPRLPNSIDSAYKTYCDGKNLFFKGQCYYEWDAKLSQINGPMNIQSLFPNLCI